MSLQSFSDVLGWLLTFVLGNIVYSLRLLPSLTFLKIHPPSTSLLISLLSVCV